MKLRNSGRIRESRVALSNSGTSLVLFKVLVSIHNLIDAGLVLTCYSLTRFSLSLFTELETGLIGIRLGKGKHSTETLPPC